MTNFYFTSPPHSFQRGRKTLFLSRVLAILALILGTCSSFAQKYEIIDEYRYRLHNDEAALVSNETWKYTGDIVVPSKVKASDGKSYKVTGIDDRCFQNCKTVTSVTLPSTISKIGQYCFADCEQMKSVNIPSAIKTISQYTFSNCRSLTSIEIPSGVTRLGEYCFSGCSGIASIKIPAAVTEIAQGCFAGTGLTSIEIPSSISSLPSYCFERCKNLRSIRIPSTVTFIGEFCFYKCIYNHRTTKTNQKYPSVNL